jgi:O-antigen/teichoic acid export membrane protein
VGSERLRGSTNAALLVLSFAIGQGSIFLAQTWLIDRGALDLLAKFATHFSFAILALMIVDAGSPVVVTRRIALAEGPDAVMVARRCYWQACAVRLAFAIVVGLIGLAYALVSGDAFSCAYVPAALPALAIWSFNATGLLDGLKLSGVSGLTGMVAYVASALALAITGVRSPGDAGLILGCALSVGYAVAVAAQLAVLYRRGCFPQVLAVSVRECRVFACEGGAVLLSTVPGQMSFRFQIVVCAVVLGEGSTALFLYGRQVAAAASQVLELVRRAHFPAMVRDMSLSGASFHTAFRAQRLATSLAFVSALSLILTGTLCFLLLSGPFARSGLVVSLFSIGVLTGALSQTLAQAAQGLGRYSVVAGAAGLSMLAGFVASAGLGSLMGLAGLAVAEVLTHAVGAATVYRAVFRESQARTVRRVGA